MTAQESKRGGDRTSMNKAGPVPPHGECSWLGRWQDNGWAIRIEPKLDSHDWDRYIRRAEESWSVSLGNYDPLVSLRILGDIFPERTVSIVWPRCGKRLEMYARDQRKWYSMTCGAVAKHTVTKIRDAYDNQVALARCEAHQGQL